MANHAHITQPSQLKVFRSNPWHEARAALEREIEKLIALLDEVDGDSDLEPESDREPSLGWPEWHPNICSSLYPLFEMGSGRTLDLEEENEHGGEADVGELVTGCEVRS